MTINHKTIIAGTAAIILLAYLAKRQATQAAESTLEAVNPTNQENIFYSGINAIIQKVTGDKNDTLGTVIYDGLH